MKQLFLFFYLCALTLLGSSCSPTKNKQVRVPQVKIDTVKTATTVYDISYPGIIKPKENLSLAFKVNGQLANVLDKEGVLIKKGTLIASIEANDYEVQFMAVEAAYTQMKKEFARITELYEAKTVSPNDYEKTQAAFQQVESKYISAKNALSYTKLYAPYDGYIQKIYHYGNEVIQAGTTVVNFISSDRFEIEINIPVQDYKKQNRCKNAILLVGNSPMQVCFKSISKEANANQLYKMRFTVLNNQLLEILTAGMHCKIILSYEEKESQSSINIPVSSLCTQEGGSYVWTVEADMKVYKRAVTILKIDHAYATVTGLEVNDRIVTSGVSELTEGELVEKIPSATNTNIGDML